MNELVPYIVHEGSMVRMERTNRRLWIVIIILILLLFSTNFAWLYYEKQFEVVTETTTVTQTSEDNGANTYINSGGDVEYGETDNNEN